MRVIWCKYFCEPCLHGYTREDLLESHKFDCRGIGPTAVRGFWCNFWNTTPSSRRATPRQAQAYLSEMLWPCAPSSPAWGLSNVHIRTFVYEYWFFLIELTSAAATDMPEEGKNKDAFQNHHKRLPVPFIIYADFENLTTKVEGPELEPQRAIPRERNIMRLAASYCYIVVRCDGQTEPPVEYRGPDAAEHLLKSLQEEESKIKGVLADPKAMRMTREDWLAFSTAETCHVCDKPLEGDSVRDHCHITGEYRGAAHNACNLKLRLNPKTTSIPVMVHNLRGYDSNLLMQAISKVEGRVTCIRNNTEKYISFSLGQLRFIDSAQFLLASLDKLVAANPPGALQITAQHEPNRDRRELLMRKDVYPYEYMDTWDRFTEPKLPPKEAFYSKLSDAHISDEDYTYEQKVWATFGCKTLGDYSDLYCRNDVLLLEDVFETFRKICLHKYGLDPAHYYTNPGLS